MIEPQTGTPTEDGRYVVYVEGKGGALEPWVTLWHDGAWRYKRSTAIFDGEIHYWIGPLPDLQKKGCINHPDRAVRENLDGDDLCQECCDNWVKAEGAANIQREMESPEYDL